MTRWWVSVECNYPEDSASEIALARAFLKNAPILILDEPTSSIDIKTEREIIEVMERLSIGRTVFIIAHRLSTLKHCDLLLGIEHGRGRLYQVRRFKGHRRSLRFRGTSHVPCISRREFGG